MSQITELTEYLNMKRAEIEAYEKLKPRDCNKKPCVDCLFLRACLKECHVGLELDKRVCFNSREFLETRKILEIMIYCPKPKCRRVMCVVTPAIPNITLGEIERLKKAALDQHIRTEH